MANRFTDEELPGLLIAEMARVSALKATYQATPMGFIAAGLMGIGLREAQRALDEKDIVGMKRAYQKLRSYQK